MAPLFDLGTPPDSTIGGLLDVRTHDHLRPVTGRGTGRPWVAPVLYVSCLHTNSTLVTPKNVT